MFYVPSGRMTDDSKTMIFLKDCGQPVVIDSGQV